MSLSQAVLDGLFLFNQSDAHRVYTLSEFNSFFIYPLIHGKARILYENDAPVALATWAFLTEEEAGDFLNMDMQPEEAVYQREDGPELWGIEFIAPYGHSRQLMRHMRNLCREFHGERTVHWRRLHDPYTRHSRSF